MSPELARDEIERRAYYLFLARDGQHGADLDDWLQAERQVVGEVTPTSQPQPRVSAAKRTTKARSR